MILRLSLKIKSPKMASEQSNPEITQESANELCRAASCIFFELIRKESIQTGVEIILPWHLSPPSSLPHLNTFDAPLIQEAIAMLLRLGIVARDAEENIRINFNRSN